MLVRVVGCGLIRIGLVWFVCLVGLVLVCVGVGWMRLVWFGLAGVVVWLVCLV